MSRLVHTQPADEIALSERQRMVLRALVAAYIAEAAPVGSTTLSHLLPVPLSSASIRNTMAELHERGLIEQPHPSAGRIPTNRALAIFVDRLMDEPQLGDYDRRALRDRFEAAEDGLAVGLASELLSEHARQLGFALLPRLERVRIQHVSFVRLSSERLLVVLVSRSGRVHRRAVEYGGAHDQAELDGIASTLNERIVGHTLREVREILEKELRGLRSEARNALVTALIQGLRAIDVDEGGVADLLLGTRLALLDQPEFSDPDRLRELFSAIETGENLMRILDRVLERVGVSVAFGGEQLEFPDLRHCALVAAPYGREGEAPQGVLGVIGPSRMDYRRVIPLVDYCSHLVSHKLGPAEEPPTDLHLDEGTPQP